MGVMHTAVFYMLLALMVVTEGKVLSRKERRRLMRRGEPIFKGNFIYELYSLSRGPGPVEPYNNVSMIYDNGNYVYKDQSGDTCTMAKVTNTGTELMVVGGETCPLATGDILRFNETGFTGPNGDFFDRNFKVRRVKRFCSNNAFKLLQCQNEDYTRTMLENARLTWTKNVWYNFHQFLHKHLCVCSLKARYDYYPYFTISFYGQCHGVEQLGTKSDTGCVTGGYENCTIGVDQECAGKAHYDAIYEVNYDDSAFEDAQSDEVQNIPQKNDNKITDVWKDWNTKREDYYQYHSQTP